MTDESSPTSEPPRLFPPSTVDAVRDAIVDHLRQPATGTDALHDALRLMARDAQSCGLRAEQVIIALKQLWGTIPEVQNATDRQVRSRLLERLITHCIHEYYAD